MPMWDRSASGTRGNPAFRTMGAAVPPSHTADGEGREENMSVILFLIFGLIVGALARLIIPGREPGGWLTSLVIGVAGAFLGGFLGRVFGLYTREVTTGGFVMSL